MAATSAEMITIWNTLIRANYPDTTALDASINLTNWTATLGDDPIAYTIATLFINIRDKHTYGWTQDLTTAQKKTLYNEVNEVFTAIKTAIDGIQSAVNTAFVALP